MDDDDERSIELSSIAAIFPELSINPAHPFTVSLDIPVAPVKPLKIHFQSSTQAPPKTFPTLVNSTSTRNGKIDQWSEPTPLAPALNVDVHQLSYLPPLRLEISLPDGYPQMNPPTITVYSDPKWLPTKTLDRIRNQSIELWEECGKDQVVYTFIDYVQQEAERAFGLANNADHKFELASDLKLVLLDYDLKCKKQHFDNETFDCGICLEPKKGKICHRILLCGHVFCVACLQDFYQNCITEGDIDSVKCLDPACGRDVVTEISPGKKRRLDKTLNPSELLQIPIQQDLVQRYVRLKRKKKLEADKNTVYCPRQWCQGAAKSKRHPKPDDPLHEIEDSDSDVEEVKDASKEKEKKKKNNANNIPMSERLAVCEDCNFAFCSVCKKGWHGELANCNPRRQAELNEEEKASLEYMKHFSTPCPTCNAPSQKTHGCNHMICFKCKTHFCYLCSAYLMPENPYQHFNHLKSTCYMRLWELEGGDGDDIGQGYGGGQAAPWEVEELDSDEEDEEQPELDAENFEEFNGDDVVNWDDDTDDEEPAPDQRRPDRPHIEIINFARNGANRRIELQGPPPPLPPVVAAVPVVPHAPQNRQRGGDARRRAHGHGQGQADRVLAQAPVNAVPRVEQHAVQQADNQPGQVGRIAAPGQGNNADEALQRFLRLALQDREDEWDSDEDDIPGEPMLGRRAQHRRR